MKKGKKKKKVKKKKKLLTLALKSFWLIYKSSNFSKYSGVDVITILVVPKEQSFNITLNVIVRQMPLNVRQATACSSFKNLLSNSQTLPQCYFHLLRKRCRCAWEFYNTFLNDGHMFSGNLGAFDALSHLMLSLQ